MAKAVSAELVLRGFGGTPEIVAEAHALKEKALGKAATVLQVTTDAEQLTAVEALRDLRGLRKGIESSRKAIKAPVLELGRKIDDIAADFLMDVGKADGRLTGQINHYQRKVIEAQRQEAAEAQTALTKAEQVKEQIIALRLKGEHDKANELEKTLVDLELGAELSEPLAITKPRGLIVRKRISFQVLDPIVMLQAYPQFWKPVKVAEDAHQNEALKLDRQAVLDELNREDGKGIFHRSQFPEELAVGENEMVKPPGMRVFEDISAGVRT